MHRGSRESTVREKVAEGSRLQKIGEHTQAGRWIKFTSVKEITAMQSILKNYIHEAVEVEESGKKVTFKKDSEYSVPEELQATLDAAPKLRRHSKRSRRGGGSPTSFMSRVRSR